MVGKIKKVKEQVWLTEVNNLWEIFKNWGETVNTKRKVSKTKKTVVMATRLKKITDLKEKFTPNSYMIYFSSSSGLQHIQEYLETQHLTYN